MDNITKLRRVMELLEQETEEAKRCASEESDYNSLDGNGLLACEIYSALAPILKRAEKIYKA